MKRIFGYRFLIVTLFLFLSLTFFAQTRSTNIQTIEGRKYYIHKIEKGQSLYAVSKLYNVSLDDIYAINPEVKSGVQAGQEIKIPLREQMGTVKPATITPAPIDTNLYYVYKVQKKETLYSISKKFKTTEEELKKLNPLLASSGLKVDQMIIVGVKKNAIKSISSGTLVNIADTATKQFVQKPRKPEYLVALMLPFKLDESLNVDPAELLKSKSGFPTIPGISVDLYLGFKKAIDSLQTDSFKVNLNLYDLDDKDSAKLAQISTDANFKRNDFIFGPLHANGFKVISRKAKENGIPIVSPLTQQNKMLYNNAFTSKTNPSQFTLMESLADYCIDSLVNNGANIMLVQLSNTDSKEISYLKSFKKYYNEKQKTLGKPLKDTIPLVKGLSGVKNNLNANARNVVVILSNNQVLVTDFTTQLAVFSNKKDVTLCGWQNIAANDNLDQEYLNQLHFTFPYQYNLTNADANNNLVDYYRNAQNTYPSEYYFIGFDVALYYLSNLRKSGAGFIFYLDTLPAELGYLRFKFTHPDKATGFDNRGVYIFRYNDYQLQKTGWK